MLYDSYGFDFNIEGIFVIGDIFMFEFNIGGFDDNCNGLLLVGL